MKKVFLSAALVFLGSVSFAQNNQSLNGQIDELALSGKITAGEYSVLKEMAQSTVKTTKRQSRIEMLAEQKLQIEELRRAGKINEGEYAVLQEMLSNTAQITKLAK